MVDSYFVVIKIFNQSFIIQSPPIMSLQIKSNCSKKKKNFNLLYGKTAIKSLLFYHLIYNQNLLCFYYKVNFLT